MVKSVFSIFNRGRKKGEEEASSRGNSGADSSSSMVSPAGASISDKRMEIDYEDNRKNSPIRGSNSLPSHDMQRLVNKSQLSAHRLPKISDSAMGESNPSSPWELGNPARFGQAEANESLSSISTDGGTLFRHFQSIKVPRPASAGNLSGDQPASDLSEDQAWVLMSAMKDNVLFANCSREVLMQVVYRMKKCVFSAGSTIIQQGDLKGEDFYVLVDGVCEVTKDEPGKELLCFQYTEVPQAFGELALLYQAPRAASVKAITDSTCYVLNYTDFNHVRNLEEAKQRALKETLMNTCELFKELDLKQKARLADALERVEFTQGQTVQQQGQDASCLYLVLEGQAVAKLPDGSLTIKTGGTFGLGTDLQLGPKPAIVAKTKLVCYTLDETGYTSLEKSLHQLRIYRSLAKVPLLVNLSKEQLLELTPKFTRVYSQEGQYVFREGELGDAFFIVEAGQFRVQKNGVPLPSAEINEGDCFGETSLLQQEEDSRRTADVLSVTNGTLLRLDKSDFVVNLGHLQDVKSMWRMVALRRTTLLSTLDHETLLKVAKALNREVYLKGQDVISLGDGGNKFYIIESGTCDVLGPRGQVLNRLSSGTPFGEAALVTSSKRTATVRVTSQQCYILALNRGDFYDLLGPILGEFKELSKTYAKDGVGAEVFSPKDVKWVKAIGVGAYAIVYLGWWKNKLYAVKTVNKQHLIDIDQVQVLLDEKAVLQGLSSEFCIQLVATAQDSRNLYMMMSPVLGGELFTLVAERLGPLPEDSARFYAACTILGLEYLHDNNILYRDLKLENLLIDSRGYVKVADLGIAKLLHPGEKTYTFKGTPDYMAPEYLTNGGVTHSADWWALGVLIYEINAGSTPFQADEPMDMFRKIARADYECPDSFSSELVSLIAGLLDKRVSRRLGSGVAGALEVKNHPWFAGLDWAAIKEMRYTAPWLPDVDLRKIGELSPPDIQGHPVAVGKRVNPDYNHLFSDF